MSINDNNNKYDKDIYVLKDELNIIDDKELFNIFLDKYIKNLKKDNNIDKINLIDIYNFNEKTKQYFEDSKNNYL